jgi:hypothetical protein
MKPTKLMLGTMILGLGMAGAAWAQPAPNHDRDADKHGSNTTARWDRDDVYRGWYNPYAYRRGDGDYDRDDRNVWHAHRDRDDRYGWRGDRDARRSWNWRHNDVRRDKRNDW